MDANDVHGMGALDAEGFVTEIVITWGEGAPLDVVHLRPGEGYAAKATTAAPEPSADAPLVRAFADRAEIELNGSRRAGVIVRGGSNAPDAEGSIVVREVPVAFERSGLVYTVRRVRGGRRVAGRGALDRRPIAYALGSALVHLVVLAIFALEPPTAGALSTDLVDTRSRIVAHYLEAQEMRPPPPPRGASAEAEAGASGGGAGGEPGEAGDPLEARTQRRLAVRGDAAGAPRLGSEDAAHAGVLGVLAGVQSAGPPSPYAASRALGADALDALGALLGASPGGSFGRFGLDVGGVGSGGRYDAADAIGAGPLATIGHGAPGRGDRPYGEGVGGCDGALCGREPRVPPRAIVGRPEAHGALAAEVIRRVVSRHRAEVRFCYEQGLAQNPALEGRVTARFLIGPNGAVGTSMIGASTIQHRGVEQCIAQAVRRWSFPAPEGGGVVTVNYPFVFRSGG
jgi:TonB family protein